MVESPTPRALFDLFMLLSEQDRNAFLKLLGRNCPAEVPFIIADTLSHSERFRLSQYLTSSMVTNMLPLLVEEARRLAKEGTRMSDEEFDQMVKERVMASVQKQTDAAATLAREELKEKRNRHSAPKNVRRNIEICDLRRKNPTYWSFGRLASKYRMRRQSILRILENEAKWRQAGQA